MRKIASRCFQRKISKLLPALLAFLLVLTLAACSGEQQDSSIESAPAAQAEDESIAQEPSQATHNNQPIEALETAGEEPYSVEKVSGDLFVYEVSPEQLEADIAEAFKAMEVPAPERTDRTENPDSKVVAYSYTVYGAPFLQVLSLTGAEGGEQVTQVTISPGYLEDQEKAEQAAACSAALLDFFCPGKGSEILERASEEADAWATYQYGGTLIAVTPIGNLDIFPHQQG